MSAFDAIEEGAEALLASDSEWIAIKPLIEGFVGIVPDAGDTAAGAVGDGKGLENVVHVVGLEIKTRFLAGGDNAFALEIADAVLVEDDLLDGNFGGDELLGSSW